MLQEALTNVVIQVLIILKEHEQIGKIKSKAMIRNYNNDTAHSLNQMKTHTMLNVHERHIHVTRWTILFQAGSYLATLIENNSNKCFVCIMNLRFKAKSLTTYLSKTSLFSYQDYLFWIFLLQFPIWDSGENCRFLTFLVFDFCSFSYFKDKWHTY